MAQLSDVINLTITEVRQAVTRPGFGTIAIFDYNTRYSSNLVRSYSSLAAMVSDSFTASDAAYLAAQAAFSATPRVPAVKVIRRTAAPTYVATLTPTAVNSTVYAGKIATPATPAGTAFTYTSDGTATVAEICTGLASAITALAISGLTATDNTTYVGLSGTSGKLFSVIDNYPGLLDYENTTTDNSTATQLDAALAEDKDWYGLISTSKGDAEQKAIAAWAESNRKLFMGASHDTTNLSAPNGSDLFAYFKSHSYTHTIPFYVENPLEFADAGWMSSKFAIDPGGEDWAFETIAGATPSDSILLTGLRLSDTQAGNLKSKNANYYQTLAGVAQTFWGTCANGDFADTIRFVDWLYSNMQLDIVGLLQSVSQAGKKIPYTDAGAAMLENVLRARLQKGVQADGLADFPQFSVTVPRVADQSPSDRANRYFPNITFAATLAGSIHSVQVTGTVSV